MEDYRGSILSYKYGVLYLSSKCCVGPQIGSEPHFSFGNMRRPPNNGQQSLSSLSSLASASAPLSLPPCHHFFSNSPLLGWIFHGARNAGYVARSLTLSVINITVREGGIIRPDLLPSLFTFILAIILAHLYRVLFLRTL